MTKVKICGIKTKEHAIAAAEAGADFFGLIFAESPRQVTPAQAKAIVAAVKQTGNDKPEAVGVFVNTPVQVVNKVADLCNLGWIQLSGNETWDYCRELNRPIIKVIRVKQTQKTGDVNNILLQGDKELAKQEHLFLLDTYEKEKYGGTGEKFDWSLAEAATGQFRIILAGGLTPDNVSEAINAIKPWGVDVSSGVETKGVKDLNKIIYFIKAVRDTDAK